MHIFACFCMRMCVHVFVSSKNVLLFHLAACSFLIEIIKFLGCEIGLLHMCIKLTDTMICAKP